MYHEEKLTFNYFYAYWDNCEKEKWGVKRFCEDNAMKFNQIDCETPEGVNESIKSGVKLLPQVIVCAGKKELFRVKGKKLVDKIIDRLNQE